MKIFLVLLMSIVLVFFSCNNQTSKETEYNDIIDTTGYFAARSMKGLGTFIIGESTYSAILEIIKEEIRNDSRRYKESNYQYLPHYSGYKQKYLDYKFDKNGNISSQFYREDFSSIFKEVKYDTIGKYLKKDLLDKEIFGCPNISEIRMYKYYIGDIELNRLELKFYKDTLFQINCQHNDQIEEGFKIKYGSGKTIDNTVMKGNKPLRIDKKITWENESVDAESIIYIEYKYDGDKYKGASNYNSSFTIKSKKERIAKEIRECENAAFATKKQLNENEKQKNINQL